ncbi:cell division protein FtsL [Gammaproteobacteria bacterium LSUCC0057]|uniref:Cell division protein FtsL n=1 Tax=Gammaproteobacteria bacterium LSUCC0057 TaxID=2559237 RepID=A0A4Y8UKZ5_9GAMM|nr:cell division protein FtsL [Gammaproteobacteria bacterium LSUCC0057]
MSRSLRSLSTVVLLWLAVLASALAVAVVSYQCRAAFAELAELQRSGERHQEQYRYLLLEQSAYGSMQRVESVAATELTMRAPASSEITVVSVARGGL